MLLYQNIFWQNVDFWNSVLIIFEKVWWKNCRSRWKISQESVKNHHLFGVVKVSGAYLRHPKSKVQKQKTLMKKRDDDVVLWPDKNSCAVLTTTFCSQKTWPSLMRNSFRSSSRCCHWAKTILNFETTRNWICEKNEGMQTKVCLDF